MSDMANSTPLLLAGFAIGYLLGSIPFGLLLTRMAGLGDVRSIGSGNIGATNVLRTGNRKLAAATLIADMLKGTVAVFAAGMLGPVAALAAAMGAFLGHCFPIWLKFRGGKGVATYVGVLVAIGWQAALVFAGVWLAMAAIFRFSSLAALVASLAVPVFLFATGRSEAALLFAVLTALVWAFHHQNISRLLKGEESRIGQKG